jgi:hypothetical protein
MGDRTATKDPTSIVLPQQKTWSWETKLVATHAAAMAAHYVEDNTRRGNLWAPTIVGNDGGEGTIKAPVLLAIPLVLFQALRAKKKPLMPHKAYKITMGIVDAAPDVIKAQADWDLVLSWCLLAAQRNLVGNSSHLSLAVEAVTEGDDEYFVRWIDQRLDSTFGPRPSLGPGGTANMGTSSALAAHDHAQLLALMASEVGKGVALRLRAVGHGNREPTHMGGGYDTNVGKGYTKEDIAALMGFAGVYSYSGSNLPDIWEVFNATKGKNIDAYRRHIYSRMKQYVYDRLIQIDSSVYLKQETIKAIVELRFNPGEGVAHLSSASKGLSVLACRACTTQSERVREQEQALSATEKTRLLDDLLKSPKGTT